MRLKKLTIRNIASIEKGEIDFENGLTDGLSGEAAPLFLISGDTGAGKTVILDCISMALYRKTPRQTSVANKRDNSFLIGEEEMGINDIEQYTRIGISTKDECFSELLFEGNDGVDYTARLDLGMKRVNGGKKGQMEHRPHQWSVRKGRADAVTGKAEVERTILDAVGLTFEQFGRMAMLAQGQFATFLTGDKKEREAILEQLTNTEHFSRYGEAIQNIFNAAKARSATAAASLQALAQHRLEPEEKESLTKESADIELAIAKADKRRGLLEARRQNLEKSAKAAQELESVRKAAEEAEALLHTDEYETMRGRVKGWDDTNDQRRWLANLRQTRSQLEKEESKIPLLHERYSGLYADLTFKNRTLAELHGRMEQETAWLEERGDLAPLYARAPETLLHLSAYAGFLAKGAEADRTALELRDKAPGLEETLASAKAQHTAAEQAVADKESEIDRLNADLMAIDQKGLTARHSELQKNDASIRVLRQDTLTLCADHKALDARRQELQECARRLESLTSEVEAALKAREEARRAEKEVSDLHGLLAQGVDEAMVTLRARMADTHASTCPLCGQELRHLDEAEQSVMAALDPVRRRSEEMKVRREEADREYDRIARRQSELKGRQDNERKVVGEMESRLASKRKDIYAGLRRLGLEPSLPAISGQLDEGLYEAVVKSLDGMAEKTVGEISAIGAQLDKASRISQQLNDLNKRKKPLDTALKKAAETTSKAEKAMADNEAEIGRQQQIAADSRQSAEKSAGEISSLLDIIAPEWREKPLDARGHLDEQAKDHGEHQKSLEGVAKECGRLSTLLDELEEIRQGILDLFPDWKGGAEPREMKVENPRLLWRGLATECVTLKAEIDRCRQAIKEDSRALSGFYDESGHDEAWLSGIMESERLVGENRKALHDMATRISTLSENEKRLLAELDGLRRLLDADPEDIPADMAGITEELTEQASERDRLTERRGTVAERLSKADADEEAYARALKANAEAGRVTEKWARINGYFGGTKFRTLVQSHILRPLLNNANIYLAQITDRYELTCSESNEQLSILVHDRYHRNQVRSATVLSGGERFMVSLALSLALSSLNRPDMNVDILFIDEGFGTLDEKSLDSVMTTLERLQEIAGQSGRRVGIISHREELDERIPVQIRVRKYGEGRSRIEIGS